MCTFLIQVDSEWQSGNHQGARDASRMARNWGIAGIVTGVGVLALSVVVFIVFPLVVVSSDKSSDNYSNDDY